MKIRESGMPDENVWKGFFEPDKILRKLGLNDKVADAADFGCGYGTFTISAAKIINGTVYAIDIEREMIDITEQKVKVENLSNVETVLRDFIAEGSGLEDESVDYVILSNILHVDEPEKLLREVYRILRPNGKVVIIHWNYDPTTPRGPPMEIRPTPEKCVEWSISSGFSNPNIHDLKPYHYGIVLNKLNRGHKVKFGIVISTNEPEVVWNAFRFGVTSLKADHEVKVFLLNKGVEAEGIKDEKYNVKEQIDSFIENRGKILACGTCLESRQKEGTDICPISTMMDLLILVEESDKILTFG